MSEAEEIEYGKPARYFIQCSDCNYRAHGRSVAGTKFKFWWHRHFGWVA